MSRYKAFLCCIVTQCSMIVALEGFTLPSGYLIKEMTVCLDNGEIHHFHFKSPSNFFPNENELRTIRFASRHLNQLSLHDSNLLPYNAIGIILQNIASNIVYVAGNAAYNFVTLKLPSTIVLDICRVYGFKYPTELPDASCIKRHRARYCSFAKCLCIKNYLDRF